MCEDDKVLWCREFVTAMCDVAPFDFFEDGHSVADYARATAPSYYDEKWTRDLGPKGAAKADISYWGES